MSRDELALFILVSDSLFHTIAYLRGVYSCLSCGMEEQVSTHPFHIVSFFRVTVQRQVHGTWNLVEPLM
jgi:hypothetical protein